MTRLGINQILGDRLGNSGVHQYQGFGPKPEGYIDGHRERRVWRRRRVRVTRVLGGLFGARDGRTQRCLRCRQIWFKKSQRRELEFWRAATLRTLPGYR